MSEHINVRKKCDISSFNSNLLLKSIKNKNATSQYVRDVSSSHDDNNFFHLSPEVAIFMLHDLELQ